jgi:hypothetical protein
MTPRPYNLPPHGTRQRYRNIGCRCVGCIRGPHGIDLPEVLTWPYKKMVERFGHDYLNEWFSAEQIEHWKLNGMGDYEADEACVKLGELPHDVFPGFLEAGLDCDIYP